MAQVPRSIPPAMPISSPLEPPLEVLHSVGKGLRQAPHKKKKIHTRVHATSQGVFTNSRCTAACMDVRMACRGYPDSTASYIHITVGKRNATQECKKGRAFDNTDRKIFEAPPHPPYPPVVLSC